METSRFPWGTELVRGLGAGAVLLSTGLLLRWALSTQTPMEVVADQVTRALPPWLFAALLGALEYWGKPLLLLGLSASWLALGMGLSLALALWARRAGPSRRVFLAMAVGVGLAPWLLGTLVLSPLSGAGPFGAATPGGAVRFSGALLLSSLAFALTLYGWAAPTPREVSTAQPQRGMGVGRREFLGRALVGAVSLAGGFALYRAVSGLLANAPPKPQAVDAGGLVPEVTPNDQFYIVSKNLFDPVVDEEGWRLEVDGLVERPLQFTYEEFTALPSVEQYVTLECISNEVGGDLIGNALWTGVPLREVLRMAGVKPGARDVVSYAADGYTESIPVEVALGEDVLLAYKMNGEPLPHKHGFPVRLIIPGRYGMKSTKWLTRLELVAEDYLGYWEQRGWDEEAIVKTTSRLDVPRHGARLPLGPLTMGGIAFAGSRGIRRVEVSVDGGKTWREARVRPALSPYTWVLWTASWEPPGPGLRTLMVRAVDGTGEVQTAEVMDPFPSGATGYHSILIRLV